MRGKRRRLWEGAKTLLILALTCSAVYLASRTLFPQQLSQLFTPPTQEGTTAGSSHLLSSQTLRPAAFSVTWEEKRYGVLYHQDDQETYTQVSALLAEALGDAATPQSLTRRGWEQSLLASGLYCEYLSPMPLDTLCRWLSGQDNPALSGAWAQRLCVTGQSLCYQAQDGQYYTCALSRDLSGALEGLAGQLSFNGARFAGETEDYGSLRWDTLVLPVTPSLPQLWVEIPISVTDALAPSESLSQLLQALSFHPQTNPLYAITGGWAINDGGETLRLDSAGTLTYRRSDSTPRFPVGDEPLETTRVLAESTVGALCGDARLYLQGVRQEGDASVITYACAYRGAAIRLGRDGWCAQFTVKGGAVESMVLKPRRYTAMNDYPILLLPQEQAAATLPGSEEQSLELLYETDGQSQSLTPFWAVRAEGR